MFEKRLCFPPKHRRSVQRLLSGDSLSRGAQRPRPHPSLFSAYLEETSNTTPSSECLLHIREGICVPTLRLAMLTFVFLRSGQNRTNGWLTLRLLMLCKCHLKSKRWFLKFTLKKTFSHFSNLCLDIYVAFFVLSGKIISCDLLLFYFSNVFNSIPVLTKSLASLVWKHFFCQQSFFVNSVPLQQYRYVESW